MIRLTVRVLLPPPAPGLDTSRNQTLDLEELDEEEVDCCATATSARREGSRGIAQESDDILSWTGDASGKPTRGHRRAVR